jgi:hypothetical protein
MEKMQRVGQKGNRDWKFQISCRGNLQIHNCKKGLWYPKATYYASDNFTQQYNFAYTGLVPGFDCGIKEFDASIPIKAECDQPLTTKL